MYPQKKKNEYIIHRSDSWDDPPTNNLEKIKKVSDKWVNENISTKKDNLSVKLSSDDILRFLFEYINTYFNRLGHHVPIGTKFESWWHRHKYGTSYQPVIQCCYIRKGKELGFSVRDHHSQKRITELALGIHGIKYDRETKVKSYYNIDVCWAEDDSNFDSNNLTLALEYEDSGKLDELFQELYLKLIHINSEFTVLCTRLNYEPDAHLISKIEEKLKKDNITKSLIFIFIAPDSIVNPTKIYFSEFIYQTFEIKKVDNNKYFINIMQSKTPEGTIIEKLK
ncbi:Uncharacterised protein [uncultured archaeon]|nr:Uncharacterised protein [uncultured archaeon]